MKKFVKCCSLAFCVVIGLANTYAGSIELADPVDPSTEISSEENANFFGDLDPLIQGGDMGIFTADPVEIGRNLIRPSAPHQFISDSRLLETQFHLSLNSPST